MSIKLYINLPDRRLPEEEASKVILPVAKGNLTVIEERAPTMQLLTSGVIILLDEDNQPFKRWFVNGGVADIAENQCCVAVEEAVDLQDLSLEQAAVKAEENEFYLKVYNYLKAFG